MSNSDRVNKDSIIAIVSFLTLVFSLVPILVLGFLNYATGDDLGYGAPGRAVIREGGNVIDFLKAAFESTAEEYYTWGGNWASGFFHRFEPSIFGERFYSITVIISVLALTIPAFLLLKEIFVNRFSLNFNTFLTVYSLMTILLIQYMPAPRGGIFWFTGISVYTLSFGFSLLALLLAIRFTDTGKLRYIVCCTLLLIYIGGSGYPEFVLSAMIIFFHGVYSVFMKKTPSRTLLLRGERAYSPKRGYLLLIPLALECISFLFSAMSPGNAKRSGSEGLTPGAERLVNTVTGSLYKGLTDPVTYIKSAPLIIIFVILVVVFTAETWDMEEHKGDVSFRRPYIVLPVLYLVYSFTYAPEIYAGDDVSSGFSGGVYDTYYFTFMICLTIAAVYMTCFVKTVFHKSSFLSFTEKMPDIRVPLFLISMIFCLVLSGRLFDNTVDYTCIKFAASGGLSDFEAQMRERIAILEDENIRDAVVPEMNDSQGPFMHMPLLSDPTAFTNKVTAEFYGKDSVIAVPREEFNK